MLNVIEFFKGILNFAFKINTNNAVWCVHTRGDIFNSEKKTVLFVPAQVIYFQKDE